MAQIQDILAKEKERDDGESRMAIHLFQEGTFYRAYEWSAWLCHRYISQFKVTKRKLKKRLSSINRISSGLNSAVTLRAITYPNDVTGITEIGTSATSTATSSDWYTLQGIRIARPTSPGIYIHQGRKVMLQGK